MISAGQFVQASGSWINLGVAVQTLCAMAGSHRKVTYI
jgi:hypothetical protein